MRLRPPIEWNSRNASLLRATALTALLSGATAIPSTTGNAGPIPMPPAEGGPVYPDDENVGGGARRAPVGSVTVYAYQTDAKGLYRRKPWGHPRLRGWATTNAGGRYEFHTIKPGPYPLRRNPPHIHMTIAMPAQVEWWIPELRFADDAYLSGAEKKLEGQKGTFASIRPLERQPDGTLLCVRDIRLPDAWSTP